MSRTLPILAAIVMLAGCNSPELAADSHVEAPKIPKDMMQYKPVVDEFMSKPIKKDFVGSYQHFASFTQADMPLDEWQKTYEEYYEGFNKPSVPEVSMDKFDGDKEWSAMRGIPESFALNDIVGECTVYVVHGPGSEDEGFNISLFMVMEGGQLKLASPYLED